MLPPTYWQKPHTGGGAQVVFMILYTHEEMKLFLRQWREVLLTHQKSQHFQGVINACPPCGCPCSRFHRRLRVRGRTAFFLSLLWFPNMKSLLVFHFFYVLPDLVRIHVAILDEEVTDHLQRAAPVEKDFCFRGRAPARVLLSAIVCFVFGTGMTKSRGAGERETIRDGFSRVKNSVTSLRFVVNHRECYP